MQNIGELLFEVSRAILGLGNRLLEIFTMEVNISWVKDIINFFGGNLNIPDTISLYYILTGGSAILLLTVIIYRMFK